MLLVSTYVAASAIEGVGVFAAASIREGELIWQFHPDFDRLVADETYALMPTVMKELMDRYSYPSPDRPGIRVYEMDNGRFMNHSDAPNTDFSRYGGGWATKDIAAGEEITCDYNQFHDSFELLPNIEAAKPAQAAMSMGERAGVGLGNSRCRQHIAVLQDARNAGETGQ